MQTQQTNDQKLIDICFQIAMTMHMLGIVNESKGPQLIMSRDELADWIARQLKICGYDTEPVGSSWGRLKNV